MAARHAHRWLKHARATHSRALSIVRWDRGASGLPAALRAAVARVCAVAQYCKRPRLAVRLAARLLILEYVARTFALSTAYCRSGALGRIVQCSAALANIAVTALSSALLVLVAVHVKQPKVKRRATRMRVP